jgi:dihydrofolate reductase
MSGPVVIAAATSLDGRLADGEGRVGWLDPYQASDFGFDAFLETVGGVIMGRTSYEHGKRLGPWPYKDMPVTVLTHGEGDTQMPTLTWFNGDVSAAVAAMRAKTEKAIWLMGGGQVFAQALAEDVVDRIDLAIIPVILGAGPFWRPPHGAQGAFRPVLSEMKPSGALRLVMERAR